VSRLDLYFDPSCPWTWITSRWAAEVAPQRGVSIRWRPYSLTIKNAGQEPPASMPAHLREHIRAISGVALGALRIVEAVRAAGGDEPIGRLYTEYGRRIHHDRTWREADFLPQALAAAGLDPALAAAAAEDPAWDAPIKAAMAEATGYVGDDVGSPILVFDTEPRRGIWGPVLSPAPTGEAALRLWDHVAGLAAEPGFFEVKRSRSGPPALPDRP
jgi:2-hydroxychromene-2-carboxylate isomerase